jgi:ABC-type sugar transport system permease subunit
MKKPTVKYIARRRLSGFLFFLPVLLFMIVFLVIPALAALGISFTNYNILQPPRFNGLLNYSQVLSFPSFWNSLGVTLKYVVVRVAVVITIGLFVGLVLNQKIPFHRFFQAVYFMPFIVPLAVTAIVWKVIFRPFSLMEMLTSILGLGPVPWLSSGDFALWAITITTVWSGVGYYSILLLAGLQTISNDVLEAALIDGAGWWQRLVRIILPLLKPTLLYVMVVAMIGSIQGFAPFLIMTDGGPGESSRVIGLMIYQFGFNQLRMGFASCMSIILLAIVFMFTLLQLRLLRHEGDLQ